MHATLQIKTSDRARIPPPEPRTNAKVKRESCDLVRVVGERMRDARSLCNMSQVEAARRLGYRNSSKLSKVEGATDTQSVPMALIVKAARLYDVSTDYLLGISGEWESKDPQAVQERALSGWLFEVWENARIRDMQALRGFHRKLTAIETAVGALFAETANAQAALERFAEINPEFEDMRAGATLANNVKRAAETARGARMQLQRLHMECGLTNLVPKEQMTLELES